MPQRFLLPLSPSKNTVRTRVGFHQIFTYSPSNLLASWPWTSQPQGIRNKFFLFIIHPVYGILLHSLTFQNLYKGSSFLNRGEKTHIHRAMNTKAKTWGVFCSRKHFFPPCTKKGVFYHLMWVPAPRTHPFNLFRDRTPWQLLPSSPPRSIPSPQLIYHFPV